MMQWSIYQDKPPSPPHHKNSLLAPVENAMRTSSRLLSYTAFCIVSAVAIAGAKADSRQEAGEPLFVSPSGDDANPGSRDKPVSRVMRAVELARGRAADKPRRVLLMAGEYYDAAVSLTPQDSNLTIESVPPPRS
jgi:hypothetical protein